MLEDASISVPAVGEVPARNGLGDLGRRELGSVVMSLLGYRRPVLSVSRENRSLFRSGLTVITEFARRGRVRHRRKVRRSMGHTELRRRQLGVKHS